MSSFDRKRVLATLASAYSFFDRDLGEGHVCLWLAALEGIDDDVIEAAFARHLRDPDAGRFCPKPADILRQINGDVDEHALVAWGEVIAAARSGGKRFDGPTQEAIDSMGGMGRLRLATEAENGFLQRQFVAAYKAYRTRAETPPLLQHVGNVVRIGG